MGQYILKAIKLNSVIHPLLLGLGVENDHAIGSKTLLTEISDMLYLMIKLSNINSQSWRMKTTN